MKQLEPEVQPDDADDRDPPRRTPSGRAPAACIGRIASVASALHDMMRDSHSVMYGRIQTASQVHIRSWCMHVVHRRPRAARSARPCEPR